MAVGGIVAVLPGLALRLAIVLLIFCLVGIAIVFTWVLASGYEPFNDLIDRWLDRFAGDAKWWD